METAVILRGMQWRRRTAQLEKVFLSRMARIAPLSGFPEQLPADYLVEQAIIDSLRHTFELHGFSGIETRAVEPVSQLLSKGETSKEIYLLSRLQDAILSVEALETTEPPRPSNRREDKNQLGLHFDLTVPFARYIIENAGKLQFPFKRYQIQKVWRGERPQEGRFREFIQADIDVVGQNTLPAHYEVELPLVMADAFARLRSFGVPPVKILVNNRKVSQGFYQGIGITNVEETLRCIDKLDKIGPDAVAELLQTQAEATAEQAQACLALAQISGGSEALEQVKVLADKYGAKSELLDTGLIELAALIKAAEAQGSQAIKLDLKIARGLDYYTGAVYESVLEGHEDLGSICSGGRYDSLATDGKTTYPGVGLSIGVSRLVSRLLRDGLVMATRAVPTAVLVAVVSEEQRGESDLVAKLLRERGIACEVAPNAAKFGKQIQFAERRGIPFVWFPPAEPSVEEGDARLETTEARKESGHQVKDIRSGEQTEADPNTWTVPRLDAKPRMIPTYSSSSCPQSQDLGKTVN